MILKFLSCITLLIQYLANLYKSYSYNIFAILDILWNDRRLKTFSLVSLVTVNMKNNDSNHSIQYVSLC